MNRESLYISAGEQQLHCLQWGSGKRLLLAFHGYGDNAEIYRPLLSCLGNDYTILSFDLPHHGKSNWSESIEFTKKDLVAMVENLMLQYKVDKVSLIGYSMGGRVALSVVEGLPACIDKVTLIATDGLAINFYFYFFTRTYAGRKMFRTMLEKPVPYIRIVNWLRKKKLVDASRHKFVMHFLDSAEGRNFLLRVWPAMNDIVPEPRRLKTLIQQYKISITIFMGAYDKIMPPSIAEKFSSGLDTVQLHILGKGHRVFDNETAQQIAASLL